MSELMNAGTPRHTTRWQLLATVSSLSLLTAIMAATEATARDDNDDRPTVWIELGGQFEHMNSPQDTWTAPFETASGPPVLGPYPYPQPGSPFVFGPPVAAPLDTPFDVSPAFNVQKLPPYSFGGEGKISFAPHGTDWTLSASVRIGRSNGHKQKVYATKRTPFLTNTKGGGMLTPYVARFYNARAQSSESHTVLDFQAGKDVGLGLFGKSSTSVVEVGVRYAQFAMKTSMTILAVPTILPYKHQYGYPSFYGVKYHYNTRFQSYSFEAHSTRSFHGIGPSLSWSGSTPVIGNAETAEFTVDWGINGALLFGRQRATTEHRTAADDRYLALYGNGAGYHNSRYHHGGTVHSRTHSVVVPNLGGFAGMSLQFPNAKVSLGYRADFFFGAMDAGIDTRHTDDMAFHGPFAKISIGLGG